jgi:peptidoglycan/LPS O-acetylase OafA/YrhL
LDFVELELPRTIRTLTGVRGFAALWVVLFHLQSGVFSWGITKPGELIRHAFWGVDILFVLSGFVLSHVYEATFIQKITTENYLRYLGLRLARIYPLHLLTFVAAFVCYVISLSIGNGTGAGAHFSLSEGIMNLTLLHAWGTTRFLSWNDVSWSISAEWFAYLFLLVPCIRLLRNLPQWMLYLITATGWCLLIFVYVPLRSSRLLDMTYDFGILRIAPEFLGGYVAYQSAKAMPRNSTLGDVVSLAGLVGLVLVCYYDSKQVLLLPSSILFVIGLSAEGRGCSFLFGNRISTILGEVSYAIYMCHVLVLIVLDGVLKRLPLPQPTWLTSSILVITSLAVIVATSCTLYLLVEQPCRRWARTKLEIYGPNKSSRVRNP